MAITIQCPRCSHEQKIDEDKAGTEVPCKVCHHLITPPAANAKAKSKLAAPAEAPKKQGVQAGLPPVQAGKTTAIAEKRTKVDEAKAGPAKKRSKGADDDDADQKRPMPRVRRDEPSTSALVWVLLGGGGLLALLLACGGVGFFFLFAPRPAADAPIAQDNNVMPMPIENNPPPPIVNPNPLPFPNPVPNPNVFPPPPENLDANNPNNLERVLVLLAGPAAQREPAFTWLNNANPNHPRRAEVANRLEGLVDEYLRVPFRNDRFFNPYFKWATKDNVPSLIRVVEDQRMGGPGNSQRHRAMQLLAQFKDPRGVDPLVKQLNSFFERQNAVTALTEMGPMAEKALLSYFHHPDGLTRDAARRILLTYKTRNETLLMQSIADLDSADRNRRDSALQWIGACPVDDARRPEVARALNKSIDQQAAFFNRDLAKALETWGTSENVPKLASMLEQNRPSARDAIRILGKIRDPNGIRAVARQLNGIGLVSFEVKNVLKECGSMAEAPVIEVMNAAKDTRTRVECVRLLGDIGTKNVSLPAMQFLAMRNQQDRILGITIQQAMLAINARGK